MMYKDTLNKVGVSCGIKVEDYEMKLRGTELRRVKCVVKIVGEESCG